MSHPTLYSKRWLWWHDLHPAPDPRRGYYWEFLVGVWCPVLRILTLLQTKKCHFPHPFSDQISKIHTHFRTWPNLACSRLSDSWGDSPVFSRFIFVFSLSQFSGPNYLRAWNRLGLIRQKLCHHYQVRVETKNSPNAFWIRIFLFRSYSFGIETINTSIHVRSRSSLEKPYPIPDQNRQSVFRPKRHKNPTLWAVHTYMAYIREYPPGPDPFHDC